MDDLGVPLFQETSMLVFRGTWVWSTNEAPKTDGFIPQTSNGAVALRRSFFGVIVKSMLDSVESPFPRCGHCLPADALAERTPVGICCPLGTGFGDTARTWVPLPD